MSKLHPCGLTKLAVRQNETGSKPFGKTAKLVLINWEKAERLKGKIKELEIELKKTKNEKY